MLDSILNISAIQPSIPLKTAALTIIISFILGLIISITYMKTSGSSGNAHTFILTIVMMPAVISIIILLIGNNVARAFGLAGAFSIIRFRSAPGDPRDIAYVLFAMAAGLACGVGNFIYATFFTITLCLLMIVLYLTKFGSVNSSVKLLKITIPEDLDYEMVFEHVLSRYTKKYILKRVKTADLGSLFELIYIVTLNTSVSQKDFIDELRVRNGNLNISLSAYADSAEY
jgi:hypothetical protein